MSTFCLNAWEQIVSALIAILFTTQHNVKQTKCLENGQGLCKMFMFFFFVTYIEERQELYLNYKLVLRSILWKSIVDFFIHA